MRLNNGNGKTLSSDKILPSTYQVKEKLLIVLA